MECQIRPPVEVEDPHLPRQQNVRPHCHAGAHWATHVFKFSTLWIMFQSETLRLIASIERFALFKVDHHNKRIELVSMGFNIKSSHNFQYYPCASFSARHHFPRLSRWFLHCRCLCLCLRLRCHRCVRGFWLLRIWTISQ